MCLCEEVLRASAGGRQCYHSCRTKQAMSEDQLSVLLAKLKDDAGLQGKLKGATDLDAAVEIAK